MVRRGRNLLVSVPSLLLMDSTVPHAQKFISSCLSLQAPWGAARGSMGLLQTAVFMRQPGCISQWAPRCAAVSYVASLRWCSGFDMGDNGEGVGFCVQWPLAAGFCRPWRRLQKAAHNVARLVGIWCRLGAGCAAPLLLLHKLRHSLHQGLFLLLHVLIW